MNYTKWTIAAFVLLALLALGGWFLPVGRTIVERLGSAAGPYRTDSCESRNGVEQCFGIQTMRQATSTVCAIRAPLNATSTLVLGTASFRVSTTSGSTNIVHLARASTFNSTTTSLGTYTIGTGAQGTFVASTTNNDVAGTGGDILDQNFVFAPGQYFVVGFQQLGAVGPNNGTADIAGFVPEGSCKATFETI